MKIKSAYILILSFSLLLGGFFFLNYLLPSPGQHLLEAHEKNSKSLMQTNTQDQNVIILSEEQMKDLDIQTKVAGPGELAVTISSTGKIILHPDKLVHVIPKISGVAKEARKNIGDSVNENEVLALLESREMADIKANYLAAKEKLALTTSLLEREKRLNEKKVSAQQDYINAKSSYEEANINFQLAKQKLQTFGMSEEEINQLSYALHPDLKLYEIRSPMQGMIISRHITRGEFVENTTTIYEIADLGVVWIEIGVYPKDLVKVKKGQIVDVLLPDGEKAQAKIIYLSPIIQDETITSKAIAELKNPGENWRPGVFVKVNISTQKTSVPLLVAKDAIQEIDGKEFIFVKVSKGFEKRQVQVGVNDETSVEILSGLNKNEEYAVSKTFLLKADLKKKDVEHEH